MTDIDDYVSGYENAIEEFDFQSFKKEFSKWSTDIEEELKKNLTT